LFLIPLKQNPKKWLIIGGAVLGGCLLVLIVLVFLLSGGDPPRPTPPQPSNRKVSEFGQPGQGDQATLTQGALVETRAG